VLACVATLRVMMNIAGDDIGDGIVDGAGGDLFWGQC